MGNEYSVNRKPASPKQVSSVVSISELKNTNEEHFKIVSCMKSMSASQASFELGRFAMVRELQTRKVFEVNQRITEDPSYYLNEMANNKDAVQESIYHHLTKKFDEGIEKNDIALAALAYIDLKEHEKFKRRLEDPAFKKLCDGLDNYISTMKKRNFTDILSTNDEEIKKEL